MRLATIFLVMMLLASSIAFAGAPFPGTYKSTDIGGLVLVGRQSESWTGPGGAHVPGNVVCQQSWDGAFLGTQWRIKCPISGPSIVIFDNTGGGGTGTVILSTSYAGGTFWFGGVGLAPWANGDPFYTGTISTYNDITTLTLVGGAVTGKVSNISWSGSFDLYPACMAIDIFNYQRVGTTDLFPFDPTYPGFLDPACATTRVHGEWGNVTGVTIDILGDCALGTEETSWGKIKTMYND